MKISETDITYVAQLANLDVAEDEREAFAADLNQIVEYVELLNTLDTDDIEPTAQVSTGRAHAGREDGVEDRDGSSEAGQTVGLFKVPQVISER